MQWNVRTRWPSRRLPFALRLRWARARSVCVRHRIAVRVVRLAVLVSLLWLWADATTAARTTRAQWAPVEIAVVAAEALAVGETVSEEMFRVVSTPSFVIPVDALTDVPTGGVLATSLERGDILSARDVQSTRTQALRLRSTDRAIGVPTDDATPTLHPGDLVELLLVSTDMTGGQNVEPRRGAVLAVHEASITVAVEADDADTIASVLVDGAVVVALRQPG